MKLFTGITLNNSIKNIFFTLLSLFVVSCININSTTDIYGVWKGNYNNNELSFVLKKDNTCVLKYFNTKTNKLEVVEGIFELDISKKPVPLSIRNISQLNYSLHTIIEFISDDSIRIAEFSPKWRLRPISFLPEKTIGLKRFQLYYKNRTTNNKELKK